MLQCDVYLHTKLVTKNHYFSTTYPASTSVGNSLIQGHYMYLNCFLLWQWHSPLLGVVPSVEVNTMQLATHTSQQTHHVHTFMHYTYYSTCMHLCKKLQTQVTKVQPLLTWNYLRLPQMPALGQLLIGKPLCSHHD